MANPHRNRKASAPFKIGVNEDDPQSWLFLNPEGVSPTGLVFGVLRKSYSGRINTAMEFGRRKMQPIEPKRDATASPWLVTAEIAEVIPPRAADYSLRDPQTLLGLADACAVDHVPALLTYLTLPFRDGEGVHVGWQRCWTFVYENFARDRQLATLLICHAPGRAGSPRPPHCHALIAPRTIGALGMAHGVYDKDLLHDQGQALVEALWAKHVKTFR